jgi:uracil-DNA glycosylase
MNKEALKSKIGDDWYELLSEVLDTETEFMIDGAREQYSKTEVYPHPSNVWDAFVKCPIDKLKVVIVGQDPYPNGEGNGLCFAVKERDMLLPASYQKILEAYNEMFPSHFNVNIMDGNLDNWAEQGVLLLNSNLTVEKGKPGSHTHYWEKFSKKLFNLLFNKNLIFVLIGSQAQKYLSVESDLIIKLEHPAYASRQNRKWKHNNVFHEINKKLKLQNKFQIVW